MVALAARGKLEPVGRRRPQPAGGQLGPYLMSGIQLARAEFPGFLADSTLAGYGLAAGRSYEPNGPDADDISSSPSIDRSYNVTSPGFTASRHGRFRLEPL